MSISISMANHAFSPTMTTATLKIQEVIHYQTRLMKYKPPKVDMGINLRMLEKSLPRHLPVIKLGTSHKMSTPLDQLKMVEYKISTWSASPSST